MWGQGAGGNDLSVPGTPQGNVPQKLGAMGPSMHGTFRLKKLATNSPALNLGPVRPTTSFHSPAEPHQKERIAPSPKGSYVFSKKHE